MQEFDFMPAYQRAERDGVDIAARFKPPAPGHPLWSNDQPPPAIGEEFEINFNRLGRAVVIGYFAEDDFLGVKCRLLNAPDWHRKQNKGDPVGHVFGAEIKARELAA